MNRETLESKFEEIAANGYTVGAIFQTAYVHDGRSRTDAWSAHLNDGKGGVLKGFGRNIGEALDKALSEIYALKKAPSLADIL